MTGFPLAATRHGGIRAVLESPALPMLAEAIPPAARTGRPRDLSPGFLCALPLMVNCFDSYNDMFRHLNDDTVTWNFVCETLERVGISRPIEPPKLHHWKYLRDSCLQTEQFLAHAQETLARTGTSLAHSLGLGAASTGTASRPTLESVATADGTNVRSLYKSKRGTTRTDPETGEIREVRIDPDARLHTSGDGVTGRGHMITIVSLRAPGESDRAFVAVDAVRPGVSEAATATNGLLRAQRYGLGATALVYDGAMHGAEHQTLLMAGLYAIAPVTAAKAATETSEAIPKSGFLEQKSCPDGCAVPLYYVGGGVAQREVLADGSDAFRRIPHGKVLVRKNKDGTHRVYFEVVADCCHGAFQSRIRLHGNSTDETQGINRPENLRPFPKGSDIYAQLYVKRRNDIESTNNLLKRFLDGRRSRQSGRARTLLDMISWAIFMNARTADRNAHRVQRRR